MKKILFICCIGMLLLSWTVGKKSFSGQEKLEIISIDSTNDFYVFNTLRLRDTLTIAAERSSVRMCQPFKRFIIADSVHETAKLKSGNAYVWIGANEFTIDGIKIKKKGELAKFVWNCNCFIEN